MPLPPKDRNALTLAAKCVYGDRNEQYGDPVDNHTLTANLWSQYLGSKVTARDVCMMNILQKISREKTTGVVKQDTTTDIAGYALNADACVVPPDAPMDPATPALDQAGDRNGFLPQKEPKTPDVGPTIE